MLHDIIYNSGDFFLPKRVKKILDTDLIGTHKKTFYISGWSIVHTITGIIMGYMYLYFKFDSKSYFLKLFIMHTFWELWQMVIGMSKPYRLTGGGNLIDTIMDTILFMVGVYIVHNYYQVKYSKNDNNDLKTMS